MKILHQHPRTHLRPLALFACALLPLAASAQMAMDHAGMAHGAMDHSRMGHGGMEHSDTGHGAPAPAQDTHRDNGAPAHGSHDSMQGGSAPPGARDPDAYSGALHHGDMQGMNMAHDATRAMLLLDRLETSRRGDAHAQALDAQAWVGGDTHRLWLKADGSYRNGHLGATRTEALWDRAIAPYWGLQMGLRHDTGEGPSRTWAAFGVQGLAPYWFEVQATAYAGEGGRTALRLEAEYDLRFTQRLILQPHAKASLHGRDDRERGIGSGLSDTDVGLRLRYEFTRKLAPYVGVVWDRKWGNTADQARAAGRELRETRVVVGLRLWL